MKSQIKRFSKSALSVILSLCMLVSCMTVGIIATDAAQSDEERVGAADNSGVIGAKERYIYCGISNNYDNNKDGNNWGFNFWGGTSEGVKSGTWIENITHDNRTYHVFRVQVYDDNNKAQFKGNDNWWDPSNGFSVTLNGSSNNAVFFSHQNDGWSGQFQRDYQVTSTASLSASRSSMTTAQSSTLTPSLSSNETYNEIKSTSYSVTTNPGSGGSVTSAGVFTATKAGTYTVTATVTYNAKDFSDITKTATATKSITVTAATTPSIDTFTIGSSNLNIGETTTISSTKSNSSNNVTYAVTVGSDVISLSGTTVKALKPGSATITASLTGATSKTVTVTIRTPQFSLSYSPSSIPATGSATSTPTANINTSYANSSSTMSSLSYSITSGTSYASINSSTGVVTSKTSDGTVTIKVTGTISYNGVSYTSAEGTTTVTVSSLPSVYFDVIYNKSSGWSDSDNKGGSMTYDSAASTTLGSMVFKLTTSSNLVANGSYYLRIWDGSDNYRPSSEISSQQLLSGSGVSCDKVNETKKMTAGAAGKYNFYYDVTNHRVYVEYPHTVTFDMNDHGTAPTSQTINYGGKVTKPNDPSAAGYTFGGWYKEATCTNAWNFSSDTVTANTTLYAKWTNLPPLDAPTIKYNDSTSATQTMNASKGSKARITWDENPDAGSYEIFKDNVSLGTTTNLYYDIERGNSYSGTYTVKAIPSNANAYSASQASNGIKFTFNKVALTKPNVSISATEIGVGDSTTVTISNYSTLSAYVTAGDAVLKRYTGEYNSTTGTGTSDGSPTSSSDVLTPASSIQYFYFMDVTQDGSDYYSKSSNSTLLNVYVSAPTWYLIGDLVDSNNRTQWSNSNKNFPVDTYDSKNIFKRTITYASSGTNDEHYFRIHNGSGSASYSNSSSQSTDMSTHNSSSTAVTANVNTQSYSMYVTGQGTYTIYVDQSTSGSPKVWVEATAPQTYTTTVYVNQDSGATNLYVWKEGTGEITAWPGEVITATTETVNDIPYYKYTFTGYLDHFSMVVNKGNDSNKSADISNKVGDKTYYVTWDGVHMSTPECSETAPHIQLGYKKGDNGTVNHLDFNNNRTVSVTLDANSTYNFWMKSANTHYNDQGNGTMTRDNCTGWSFINNNTDTKITTDLAGTYTFTYTVSGYNFVMNVTYPPEPKHDVTINQGDHGTLKVDGDAVSGSSIVVQLGEITKAIVEAVAAEGYRFKAWTTTGGVAAESGFTTSSNPISIGASADGTMTATYEENSYTLTLASAGNGSITTPSTKKMTVYHFTETSMSGVTVTPANGYKFNGWTSGTGVTLTGGSTTNPSAGTVRATQDSTLTATFTKVSYNLTGQTSLNGTVGNYGTVKFYSNADCTTEITTSQIGNTVYAKFTSSTHTLVDFTLDGTGTSNQTTDGNIFSFKMGYSDVTLTANVAPQSSVTYYVDMHDNSMSGKTVQVAIVSNGGGTTVLKDGEGEDCSATLVQQGNSTVYAAEINTPTTKKDTNTYGDLYVRVTYTGKNPSTINVPGTKVETLVNSHEMWLEAENEASSPLTFTYGNRTTPTVQNGYRRIYLAKPYSWQDDDPDKWENIGIYHWGNYTDIGWNKGIKMHHLGYSGTGENDYHYYYADIPKALDSTGTTVVTNGTGNKVSNIIFQGWGSNTSAGDYSKAQTGNIENIPDLANFYILSEEDGAYVGTKSEDDAVIPNYTRYVSSVTLNKTESKEAKIAPTYTGKITYTSKNTSIVTVDSDGTIHPHARGTTKITVNIYGTIDDIVKDHVDEAHKEYLTYDVNVTVRDPEQFNGFEIMSLNSKTYTVEISKVDSNGNPVTTGGTQPGYFDMDNTVITVEGIHGVESSTNSAIITQTTQSITGVGTVCTSFTVKYAEPNSLFSNYSGINVIGKIVSKSIKRSDAQRFGHDHWEVDGTREDSFTTSRVIDNGVETATTNGIAFDNSKSTYSAVFVPYTYVDVNFTFKYYEYVPEVDADGMINYPYDAVWAGNEDSSNSKFDASHIEKTYTVSNYEVRNYTADSITTTVLANVAATAIGVMPSNNYYTYSVSSENTTKSETGTYTVASTVNMTQNVRKYKVVLNVGNNTENIGTNYSYQQYAEVSNQASNALWYAVSETSTTINEATDPLLATGSSYKFRVKGDTYLSIKTGTVPDGNDFNRSEVDFSHYEVQHRDNPQHEMVDYLLQNFYIADFFSPAKVLDPNSNDGEGNLPYDDAQFVGGGVVYYSMNGVTENSQGTPFANAVSAGYVNGDTESSDYGKINEDAVKEMLKTNIEAQYAKDSIAGTAGEETAMKVAYGTEIAAKKNVEGGFNTGIIYRYLPLNQYKRDTQGVLLNPDEDGNYAYDVNTNTFRYSNTLQSYQYVYASGNENKETNAGKNMRLYSYYVYSYVAYNQETNVPETKYEIVISDNYSDASTYWEGNPNPDPSN